MRYLLLRVMLFQLVGLIYGSNFSFSNDTVLDMVIEIRSQTLSQNYESKKAIQRAERNLTCPKTRECAETYQYHQN
jgi:hypothetical protein